MPGEMMKTPDSGQGQNKESINWADLEMTRGELAEIFQSLSRELDKIKAMTEIAQERGIDIPAETQEKTREILERFEPAGKHNQELYRMINDLGSISTAGYEAGVLITAPELKAKLDEIKAREAKQ